MTDVDKPRSPKVGKLRPSQVVTQHGPGAVVDLPELSVIVGGLYRPPQPEPGKFGGMPSFVFPEWLVCPRCRQLGPFRDFHFRSSFGDFVCTRNDNRHGKGNPTTFPARFMVACAAGHLDDFPWK